MSEINMNDALTVTETANLTMSSREIANLTEKRHADVMRDIRNMLGQLELQADGYQQNCVDPQNGQMYPVFKLPKDLTLTLVAGYNVKLRKRIIDRWLALEAKVGAGWAAIPQTLPEALRLAADLAEAEAAHQHRIQAAARGNPAQRCGIESQQGVADDGYPQQIDDGKGDAEFAAGKHRAGEKGKAE